ncbi:UDP-3-O-(3-hydroxymyristoyl)glucosamine N-acyltransferase [Litoreibacter roseus]|uniref:UDP-3-O-acylglucosamine N-acyltransferase n=1 Tax=Litoreibacter roseus TaxID=2601869 RepID=A0A6N6JLN2_9RHOB|nr:UDP-3-O-(3-hydroxymyristoyl)glucosamine N-acyltransferase [Litoreibacter roseus]GFE66780.1 UDP-3-O-(3-hydroxymyristoyl)glucosamine N-acyltransferase [Litoreibacter roseus]
MAVTYTVSDIAAALSASAVGNGDIEISRISEPATADRDALALAMNPNYAEGLKSGQARAAILWDGADWQSLKLEAAIYVPRPRYAMSDLTRMMDPGPDIAKGIHPSSIVHQSATIGDGAAIAPFVMIGADVKIGARARIASHVSIAEGAVIGDDAMIMNGVRIGARVQIGNDFIAQPGAVLGADGFSFVTPEKGAVENVRDSLGDRQDAVAQEWTRIHSLGALRIGDRVEIGANATIDRGTIRDTSVGSGTKIDNLVQVGHNCQIGEDCLLCGLVGVAGSVKIGNRVVLAGKVGVNDNIFIGDDVVAGGGSKIFTNVPAGRVVLGHPAVKMETQMEIQKAVRRLPRLMARLKDGK